MLKNRKAKIRKLEIRKLNWSKGFSPKVKLSGLARIQAKALIPAKSLPAS